MAGVNWKRLVLPVAVLSILIFSGSAFAAEFKADMAVETGGETITSKVYVSGSLMRHETKIPGGGVNISIFDGARGVMYVLMPEEKMFKMCIRDRYGGAEQLVYPWGEEDYRAADQPEGPGEVKIPRDEARQHGGDEVAPGH